jgi:short-subunit dehydrogenase
VESRTLVITGASSGIGRTLAHRAARRGDRLVLAARREEALEALVDECAKLGGQAHAVALDVTDAEAVDALAREAVAAYGTVDAWINDAGVYLVGTFEETPPDAFRRVVDVNFFGVVNGSRAALRVFRDQGRGVLVNISSLVGGLASPYVSAYAASKWAIRGFTLSLREEIRDTDIHACVVRPASIDTPIFRRAANYSGRSIEALAPVYDVELAAGSILKLVDHPKREVIVGRSGRALSALHAVAPAAVDRVFAKRMPSNQFRDGAAPRTAGNLWETGPEWATETGNWT